MSDCDPIARVARQLEQARFGEYVQLLHHPGRLLWRGLLAGIARGVGIAIGFTLFSAIIVYGLQQLGALNVPVIGTFIARIVKIVQVQLVY